MRYKNMKILSKKLKLFKERVIIIKRDILLFLESPKAYLYTFTFSKEIKIHIKPYNPKLHKIGEHLVKKIKKAAPDLKIYFIGAANLGIVQGYGDIDLLIQCQYKKFERYLPKLVALFGKPKTKRQKYVEWQIKWRNRYDIDLALADPSCYIFQEPIKSFQILKNNKKILGEYEIIKKNSNGVSLREYKRRKLEFFYRITGDK